MININKKLIKQILIVFALIVTVTIVFFFITEYLSWKNVNFNLSKETKSIKIYSKKDNSASKDGEDIPPIKELKGSGSVKLKVGDYYVWPTGNNISSQLLDIKIKNDTSSVDIKPYYSDDYLSTAFTDELKMAREVVESKYTSSIEGYGVSDGVLYHYGDWYGAFIFKKPKSGEVPSVYGVILHEVDNQWIIMASPSMLFKYSDHKDIPTDIIDSVNRYVNGS